MRHKKSINHLGRTASHRSAMLSNMAISLIMHKRISTTVAKAKALRTFVEPLITRSKADNTHSRRMVFSSLQSKDAVTELFRDISVKVADRPGGYTRILKTGNRLGDNAEMCIIELVDFNETMLGAKETKVKTTTRRRRGAGTTKKTADEVATPEKAVKEKKAKKSEKAEEPKAEIETPKAETETPAAEETDNKE